MAFHGVHRPLQDYLGALRDAGLLLEDLREPAPTDAQVRAFAELARARRRPVFLHLLARRP